MGFDAKDVRLKLKKIGLWLGAMVLLLVLVIQISGHGYIWRALLSTYGQGHATAHIDDASEFAQTTIAAGAPQPWAVAPKPWAVSEAMKGFLTQHRSSAFLVAHQGQIVHESYWAPYGQDSKTNGFSMAKTLTTVLAGAAVADGVLPSFDAPVGQWLGEYAKHPEGRKATLAQLSAMTSGHEWTENYYLPFNATTEMYYGGDVTAPVLRQGFERPPGSGFEYSSASTQLLAVALNRALQTERSSSNLSAYLSERFWKPLGMSADASWSLDRSRAQGGMEMAYCCVHTSARNWARWGQLLLQRGQWQGQALLPEAFVQRMTTPNGLVRHYGHGLWMDPDYKTPFYYMQGHLGQYVIVIPSKDLVVVRLGQSRKKVNTRHPVLLDEVYGYVDEALRMLDARP